LYNIDCGYTNLNILITRRILMGYMEKVEYRENKYVLPIVGQGMNCPVVAFLSPKLFQMTDERIWQQAVNATKYPRAKAVYLMPDCHMGYHVPVGCVLITDGIIAQAGSGYDISCGMIAARIEGITAADVADPGKRNTWIDEVQLRVPTGLGSHRPPKARTWDLNQILEFLIHGAKPLGVDRNTYERLNLPVDTRHFKVDRIDRAFNKLVPQMGSLGSGNHFIEMLIDPEDASVWVMVHCGSRGYGHQTAEYYYHKSAEYRGINKKRREESWLDLDDPLGQEFWAHHNSAANYAIANRWCIMEALSATTEAVFGADLLPLYDISHNLAQEETLADGSKGIVHRKGSTRAMPAGHPNLAGTGLSQTGHPILIPGSMLHGATILMPGQHAADSGYSVNHGCGRVYGRAQAKRELSAIQEEIDNEMQTHRIVCNNGDIVEGIIISSGVTPLDECGYAYKNIDDVLGVVTASGIGDIKRRLLPVANIKG